MEFSMMQQVEPAPSPSVSSPNSDRNGIFRSDDSALEIRHDWTAEEAAAIYHAPFMDLLLRAQTTHRTVFDPNKVQFSKLLNIKAGGCPEDCGYCSQSANHDVALQASKLMDPTQVIEEAKAALAAGATRYSLGAWWRSPTQRDMATATED